MIRGRSFRSIRAMLGASSLTASALAMGCAGARPPTQPRSAAAAPAAARPAPAARAEPGASAEQREQRDAQRAWCSYLEALYQRAADHAARWPRFQECVDASTSASPEMLRRTAECSMQALKQFEGDPFTPAYAAEVGRCGAEAMTATTLPHAGLAPFMTALCGRIARCGQVDHDTCRRGLMEGLGDQLGRAIGAMNSRGRQELRACFLRVSCEEVGPQITACLQTIMDDLLWLPAGESER